MKNLFGLFATKEVDKLKPLQVYVKKVNELESTVKQLSDAELKSRIAALKQQVAGASASPGQGYRATSAAKSKTDSANKTDSTNKTNSATAASALLTEVLPEVFALVREAASRKLNLKLNDSQILAAVALHFGKVVEMETGEGKNLTCAVAAVLNSLTGEGVHIITFNDHLAKRTQEELQPLYDCLGISTVAIFENQQNKEKRKAYSSDVVYCAMAELGSDYVRDLAKFTDVPVQRTLACAIIYGVDHFLIDNPSFNLHTDEGTAITYGEIFKRYTKLSGITESAAFEGIEYEKLYGLDVVTIPLSQPSKRVDEPDVIFKTEAAKLHALVEEIITVHQTGRPILITVATTEKAQQIAAMLRKPKAMTEVLQEKTRKTISVLQSQQSNTASQELVALLEKTNPDLKTLQKALEEFCEKEKSKKSLKPESRELAMRVLSLLATVNKISSGLELQILSGQDPEKEAQFSCLIGKKGAITIIVAHAARGTFIRPGGDPYSLTHLKLYRQGRRRNDANFDAKFKELEAKVSSECAQECEEIRKAGGICVFVTERHDSRRQDAIMRQLVGCQGEPGTTQFVISLEDSLMRSFGGDKIKQLMDFLKTDEDVPIENALVTKTIDEAQKKVELHNTNARANKSP